MTIRAEGTATASPSTSFVVTVAELALPPGAAGLLSVLLVGKQDDGHGLAYSARLVVSQHEGRASLRPSEEPLAAPRLPVQVSVEPDAQSVVRLTVTASDSTIDWRGSLEATLV
jgi:hypothetical protein